MKKIILTTALLLSTLVGISTLGNQEAEAASNNMAPYFQPSSVSDYIGLFESKDFFIPRLPNISGTSVNLTIQVKSLYGNDNFLVERLSSDGKCVISKELVVGQASKVYTASTYGLTDFEYNFPLVRVTNYSAGTVPYTVVYNYKLSFNGPDDFDGLL